MDQTLNQRDPEHLTRDTRR